jgi:hypothetical protein
MKKQLLKLKDRHHVTEKEKVTFKLTDLQVDFIEEYLSNGMTPSSAAKYALSKKNGVTREDDRYYSAKAPRLLNSPRVQAYLLSQTKNSAKFAVSSVDSIISVVSTILHNESEETKDRLKAAELLLKHYDGFKKHNESKSTKSIVLNNVQALDDRELDKTLQQLSQNSAVYVEQVDDDDDYDDDDDDDIIDIEIDN